VAHPRAWPVRWRLAAVSSGLTLLILVVVGGAIGQITTQRIRDDFNEEVKGAAEILSSKIRIIVMLSWASSTIINLALCAIPRPHCHLKLVRKH